MEVITIEAQAWQDLIFAIKDTKRLTKAMFETMQEQAQDRWLSPEEAAKYTGFKPAWIKARAAKIGAFQDGCGLRFKKSDIDKYFEKNSFKTK